MRPDIVHLVLHHDGRVAPLCGAWGESTNWTLQGPVATCPGCRTVASRPGGRGGAGGPAEDAGPQGRLAAS